MLLASDFQPREFDEVALEIEVQIFNIRVDFERRVIFLFFDLSGGNQKFLGNVVLDDAGFASIRICALLISRMVL